MPSIEIIEKPTRPEYYLDRHVVCPDCRLVIDKINGTVVEDNIRYDCSCGCVFQFPSKQEETEHAYKAIVQEFEVGRRHYGIFYLEDKIDNTVNIRVDVGKSSREFGVTISKNKPDYILLANVEIVRHGILWLTKDCEQCSKCPFCGNSLFKSYHADNDVEHIPDSQYLIYKIGCSGCGAVVQISEMETPKSKSKSKKTKKNEIEL